MAQFVKISATFSVAQQHQSSKKTLETLAFNPDMLGREHSGYHCTIPNPNFLDAFE